MNARPRLKQLPLVVVDDDLRDAVAALPADLRRIAEGLHRLGLGDGRSWLDVVASTAAHHRTTLKAVLACSRAHAPALARRASWWSIRERTACSQGEIATAFRVHPSTVCAALKLRDREVEQLLAVESYQAETADTARADTPPPPPAIDGGDAQLALDWDRERPQMPVDELPLDRAAEDAAIADAQAKLEARRARGDRAA